MVKEGQAVVYRQDLLGCTAIESQYLQAELQAKQKRLRFWNQPSLLKMWNFRRAQHARERSLSAPLHPVASQASHLLAGANRGVA